MSIPLQITPFYCFFLLEPSVYKHVLLYIFFSFFIQGALNISSSRTPNNRTIQNFVKNYVDDYVGVYNFIVAFRFCFFCVHLHSPRPSLLLRNRIHTELVNTSNRRMG